MSEKSRQMESISAALAALQLVLMELQIHECCEQSKQIVLATCDFYMELASQISQRASVH